jgi:sugar phosphate isomerase/epimerase
LLAACGGSSQIRTAQAVGVQLYTVRDLMAEDVAGTLAAVAGIGYREVEFAGYFNQDPHAIRSWLDAEGLTAPSAHFHVEDWEPAFEVATILGHRYLVDPWIAPDKRETLDDYRRVAETFNEIGLQAQAAGFQFAYHNHDFEFQPMDGQIPFDVLLAETDPDLVQIQLDLFWTTHGGGDPLEYFAAYPGRYPSVHVKDRSPDGTMVDVGRGAIDFPAIFADAEAAGVEHYFVEHDSPDDSLESIRRSYAHLVEVLAE